MIGIQGKHSAEKAFKSIEMSISVIDRAQDFIRVALTSLGNRGSKPDQVNQK